MADPFMQPSLTFVTCIESGFLEPMVILLAESIRTWGGALKDSPIVAYTPRIGAPLCRSTQQRFRELDVDHRRIRGHNEYPFYNFFNKPLAVATAEEEVETDQIAWIDGDMLCVGDLEGLLLDADHDVAACPCDSYPGTTGPGSDHEAYWRAICEL